MNGKCPAVVSDADSKDHACTHLYLLEAGKVIKSMESCRRWGLLLDAKFWDK